MNYLMVIFALLYSTSAWADELAQIMRAQEVKNLAEQRFMLESRQCSQRDPLAGAVYRKCVGEAQQHLQEGVKIASEVMDGKRDMKTLQPKRAPASGSTSDPDTGFWSSVKRKLGGGQ